MNFYILLSILIPIIVIYTLYNNYLKKKAKQERLKEEEERRLEELKLENYISFLKRREAEILDIIDEIANLEINITSLYKFCPNFKFPIFSLNLGTKYISNTEIKSIILKISSLGRTQPPNLIPKNNIIHEYFLNLVSFSKHHSKIRDDSNSIFIADEKKHMRRFFLNILEHPLDNQQIDAILHDEDNCLVIAGAGCGKTTTIEGKVNYILEKKLAKPSEILLMSFSKISANDLKNKLGDKNVECKTFHALAYDIIRKTDRVPDVFNEGYFDKVISDIHKNLIKDESYLKLFNEFILNGLKIIKTENEFDTIQEYIAYKKENEFESLKGLLNRQKFSKNNSFEKKTINNEFVKSGEECVIANFLFINRVEYSYELPYYYQDSVNNSVTKFDKNKKRYRPDFTIYLNGYNSETINTAENPPSNLLYLEHYGIGKNNTTPKFFTSNDPNLTAHEAYIELMEWKENIHQEFETTLIKTFSRQFDDGTIISSLKKMLLAHNVQLNPMSEEEILTLLNKAYPKEIQVLFKLIKTFISLYKSNNKTFNDIYSENELVFKDSERERNNNLLKLIERIYNGYNEYLKINKLIDFNDLINDASTAVHQNKYLNPYKYIIVDEFQDISINRSNLLNYLKDQNNAKLFAVGDDWQSIYRFAGSDLTLFNNFENRFGYTVHKKIETTYRFANPLIDISSQFILMNPTQINKNLSSKKKSETKVHLIDTKETKDFYMEDLEKIISIIYSDIGPIIEDKSILLLGRYNFDFDKIKPVNDKKPILFKKEITRETINSNNEVIKETIILNKEIDYLTVHRSKGLQADIVILINCESGRLGFPAELSDDIILDLLLTKEDSFANAEERRAFYVALTRAKESFYFYVHKPKMSKFIQEIFHSELENSYEVICNNCHGEMVFIKQIYNHYYGNSNMYACKNSRYGCENIQFESINDD